MAVCVNYYFYVNHYSGDSTLAKSGAEISISGMELREPIIISIDTTAVRYEARKGQWLAFVICADRDANSADKIVPRLHEVNQIVNHERSGNDPRHGHIIERFKATLTDRNRMLHGEGNEDAQAARPRRRSSASAPLLSRVFSRS